MAWYCKTVNLTRFLCAKTIKLILYFTWRSKVKLSTWRIMQRMSCSDAIKQGLEWARVIRVNWPVKRVWLGKTHEIQSWSVNYIFTVTREPSHIVVPWIEISTDKTDVSVVTRVRMWKWKIGPYWAHVSSASLYHWKMWSWMERVSLVGALLPLLECPLFCFQVHVIK